MASNDYPTSIINIAMLLLFVPWMIFFPGYLLVGYRLKEKIDAFIFSILISLTMIFFVSSFFYQTKSLSWIYHLTALIIITIGYCRRFLLRELFRNKLFKTFLLCFALFILIMFSYTLCIHSFSGGNWTGDWEEHYFRTLFFKEFWDKNILIRGVWLLPARPPLINVIASFFMHFTDNHYYYFQVIQMFLNSLEFIGVLYFMWVLTVVTKDNNGDGVGDNKGYHLNLNLNHVNKLAFTILIFMVLNPSVVQNITYPWNKALFSFFTIVAMSFAYRRFCSRLNDSPVLLGIGEGLSLGLATLTHYGALPFIGGLFFLDFWQLYWAKKREVHKVLIYKYSVLILICCPWFLWAYYYYGKNFMLATSTAKYLQETEWWYLGVVILKNSWNTLYPNVIQFFGDIDWKLDLINKIALRDLFFMIYQINFLFILGSFLWVIAIKEIWNTASRNISAIMPLAIAFFVVWIGASASTGRDYPFGMAHIGLKPLALLGLVVVAVNFSSLNIVTKIVAIGSIIFDWVVGVVFHLFIQNKYLKGDESGLEHSFIISNIRTKIEGGHFFLGDFKWSYIVALMIFIGCMLTILFAVNSITKMMRST